MKAVKGNSALIKDGKLYVLDAKAKSAMVLSMGDLSKGATGVDLTITQWLGSDTPVTHATKVVELDPEVWEHPEWGIPLQTLSGGEILLNYKNIVTGPQPKELFEVPAGYKVKDLTDAFGALMKAIKK